MQKTTNLIRLISALLGGMAAGVQLVTSLRAHIRQVAQDQADDLDQPISELLKKASARKAHD